MVFEILKAFVILLIAVPFLYIVLDVIWDITKRTFEFSKQLKPILVKIKVKSDYTRS